MRLVALDIHTHPKISHLEKEESKHTVSSLGNVIDHISQQEAEQHMGWTQQHDRSHITAGDYNMAQSSA
jgi:hypothetical protein